MRFALLAMLLLAGVGCGAGAWRTVQPGVGRFVVPGARDVQVTDAGLGQRLITYRMANPQEGWLTLTARRLTDEGWEAPTNLYVWGSTENYSNTFTRRTRVWRIILWEQARLDGDARDARITVRHWVEWR